MKKVVSAIHSLDLIPVSRFTVFARTGAKLIYNYLGGHYSSKAIPGSIEKTDSFEDGIITKTITYELREVDEITIDLLEGYRHTDLIAFYTDERGQRRVSGSPDYPLSFNYTMEEGVIKITLTGQDTLIDAFASHV